MAEDQVGGPEVLDFDKFSQQTMFYIQKTFLCGHWYS